jgi:hypothetical protein
MSLAYVYELPTLAEIARGERAAQVPEAANMAVQHVEAIFTREIEDWPCALCERLIRSPEPPAIIAICFPEDGDFVATMCLKCLKADPEHARDRMQARLNDRQ